MTDWARTARVTAAALVRAEAFSLRTIRASVQRTIDSVVRRLASIPPLPPKATAERAIRVVRESLQELGAAVAIAVLSARRHAKAASTARLDTEWGLAARSLQAAGFDVPPELNVPIAAAPEDDAEASLAGQSYATAWGAAMLGMIWRWAELEQGTITQVASQLTDRLDYRVRRIATTETSKAFADARDEGMGWLAEHHRDAAWFPLLLKVWDASLDRKVCSACAELDGTQRPWGLPFPDGAEPGYVHANCRCVPVTNLLPLPMRGETIPGRTVDDERPREAS